MPNKKEWNVELVITRELSKQQKPAVVLSSRCQNPRHGDQLF